MRNEPKIIKIQGIVRGFLQRKVNRMANEFIEPKPQVSHRSREKFGGGHFMLNKGKPLPAGS